jgi:heme oxygenase
MSLKKLTKSKHSGAERSWFASLMMSGKITNEEYAVYLKQQFECYNALEDRFKSISNSISTIPENLKRATPIMNDLKELSSDIDSIPIFESTKKYTNYILNECKEDILYAHVYVRYLGDLKGGQMIAKRIPGSGQYYKFEKPEELESFIRNQLSQDENFVQECNKCFDSAINLFKDLKGHLTK